MERLRSLWKAIKRFWKNRHINQILLLLLLVLFLLSILFFAFMASQANVSSLKEGLSQSTVIYDKNEETATAITTNRTEGIEIDEVPDHVPNAIIAIEDERFYKHNGFDIKGMARAFFNNLFAGRITGGGSTITQQLTKNALLSSTQTYKRKVEELFLAVEIEKHYSKNEILQMYVNQVYFGSGAWGINQASKKYFNKNIENISISEAALLAGLLKAPSALDPYNNYKAAMERRNLVLNNMNEMGMISDSEYKNAKIEKIELKDGGGSTIKRDFPYYVDAVLDEAINKYGLSQDEILTRGYRIYTELDQNIQASLEDVYKQDRLFPRDKGGAMVQSGAVLLDPSTGGVRGLVGGRGDAVFRGFNRATHIKAQPGSTMKPLAAYTPALEEGYEIDSILKDEPIVVGSYKPENFSKTFGGDVPMYKALEHSLNVPAVWLLNEIGLEKGLDALNRFGISVDEEDKYLGIALGGMHKGISPLELAEAYSAFPNQGKRNDSHFITKIVGPTGNIITEHKGKTTKVTSKAVANDITSMLLNVVETGTGKEASISGVQLAGKTGSTQLPYSDIDGTKDQWFVGYTPNLVGSIWLGYDQTDREHYLSGKSSDDVVPIFKKVMEKSLQYTEPAEFEVNSVNAMLAGEQQKQETRKAIKEKAEEIEGIVKEESKKWPIMLEQAKQDFEKVSRLIKDKVQEFVEN
ncbi:transglycosylase domain-containing protein [Metabacillus herbersteinensis]|uniref:Transglycosylase domain-containing protein n=1 Tax=Metabacillus herbersteinensis TaxID=283816 RepID=A0ABV6GKI6_9BACI